MRADIDLIIQLELMNVIIHAESPAPEPNYYNIVDIDDSRNFETL